MAGLRLIEELHTTATTAGIPFTLVTTSRPVLRLLTLRLAAQDLTVYATMDAALTHTAGDR